MIECPCKVEFIPAGGLPVVLVDVGGWVRRLPRFSCDQGMFETGGVQARESHFKPLGGALVSIGLEVETEQPDFAGAMEHFVAPETAGSIDLLNVNGELVITGETTAATYSPAIIRNILPGLPGKAEATTTTAYHIEAALPVISTLP